MQANFDPQALAHLERDFLRVLSLNQTVGRSLAGKKLKDRHLIYSDALATKVFQHAATVYHLWKRHTKMSESEIASPVDFIDTSSLAVVTRACFEACLAFHYVYVWPESREEKEFRHAIWMISGLTQRQAFKSLVPSEDFDTDEREILKYQRVAQRASAFARLTEKAKKDVLGGRQWHPGSTLSGMTRAIFGPEWGRAVYGYLSAHAHGDALGASHVRQDNLGADEGALLRGASLLMQLTLVLAHLTHAIAAMYVEARKTYKNHEHFSWNEHYVKYAAFVEAQATSMSPNTRIGS